MGKKIGIKLADGSFYPIMEDGVPQKKLMELTTVQDNQTTASIDLYRSESGTMEDAEYVDTLEISGLVPHPGGEADISFTIQLDENNMLSAEVADPESGKTSTTKADLVNLPSDQRNDTSDYTLSEVTDIDFEEPPLPEAPMNGPTAEEEFPYELFEDDPMSEDFSGTEDSSSGADNFDLPDFDLGDFASIDSLPDTVSQEEKSTAPEAPAAIAQLPDFETTSFDLDDFAPTDDTSHLDALLGEDDTFFSAPTEDSLGSERLLQDESTSFDLPDFDEPVQNKKPSSDLPDFGESAQEDIPSFSLPDFGNDSAGFADSDQNSAVYEDSLPDFSKFELPDFDEPTKNDFSFGEESGLFTENDFKDPAFQVNNAAAVSDPFDFSGLYEDRENELRQQENRKRRSGISVVICVICALICVGILLFMLFLFPSRIADRTISSDSQLIATDSSTTAEQEAAAIPDETAAIEDVIVIVETPSVTPAPPPQATKEPEIVRYKVKWGDTLWDIAQSYYNNPWLYKRIASANNIKNPDYIVAGTVLTIPPQ